MNKQKLVNKLEEGAASLRAVLNEHEGSTLQALAGSVKQGFETMRGAFANSETAQKATAELRKQLDELENAVTKGDRELSNKVLTAIEKKIQEYKEKNEEPKA